MEWLPAIAEAQGPVYLRIVNALVADIASGRLARGQQLPTHRALAAALDVDLTTVTRAYGEARRRGLVEAQTGRGTFVSETTARHAGDIPLSREIDLSMNVPPQPVEANLDTRIIQGLQAIQAETGLSTFLNYQPPGGSRDEREIAVSWLRPRVPDATAENLLLYPGNQAILFNALLTLAAPGDVVLTEALTFPGIKTAAARLGISLVGVAMDEQGIDPDALRRACREHRPKAVYLTPTQHNPTTATLPPDRRAAIAEIIRGAGTFLIEDDAYGLIEPAIAPIATLIPERSYLAVGLSKCIAPALRVSYLVAPNEAATLAMHDALQATVQMPPPLMVALVTHWLRRGIADQIIAAIRHEAAGRQQMAAKLLAGLDYAARPASHHLWLRLPRQWSGLAFLAHAARHSLALVGAEAFAVGDAGAGGLRVALGAARSRAELAQALQFIAGALQSPAAARHVV